MTPMEAVQEVVSSSEVKELETDLANIQGRAQSLVVKDEESYQFGAETLTWIQSGLKKCEDRRKFFVKPLQDHVSRINLFFKNFTEPLDGFKNDISRKLLTYRSEQEQKRREEEDLFRKEQEKLQKKAEKTAVRNGTPIPAPLPIVAIPVAAKTTFNDLGAVTAKKTWQWDVVNLAVIPREYLCVDEKKINALVRAGVREIKGIKIYQTEILSVKA
jgi:hypothetical protein